MKKIEILLIVIAVSQILLGIGFMFFPNNFFQLFGYSQIESDLYYFMGMFSARLFVFGAMFLMIVKKAKENVFLINSMIAIQLIDLFLGIYYNLVGFITLSMSLFPMINAFLFALLLQLWKVKDN
jgi:hypothetical protein